MPDTLHLDSVPPGAILAAAVLDARGNVLVPEGRALTPEWIQRLKGRGITKVTIQPGAASPEAASAATAVQTDRMVRFDAMFARHAQDPLMQALAAAAKQVLSE